MSIFRDTFQPEIKQSLEFRQKSMTNRTPQVIQYLNSRNAWIRMTSTVNVNGSNALASQYVLQGGTLNSDKTLKSGVGNSSNDVYSTISPGGKTHRLGIRPMPGITSLSAKSKSAYGSLREITVKFQCWDIKQLEDLEILYMRPGYTILVEWGWVPYFDEKEIYQPTFTNFYSDNILNPKTNDYNINNILSTLYKKSVKAGGNYDALYGYIKNYEWSAREDGGYDCSTTIISIGEMAESLKVNYIRTDLDKLYASGSVGTGLLDELFEAQGGIKSIMYTDYYQKNVLAGIWAELALKLQNADARVKSGSLIENKSHTAKFPGLEGYGDFDKFIQPGETAKTYITLESAFDIINKFVLIQAKPGNVSLVKLSTKAETYSGKGGGDLLCVAHPLQVSIDPTVCLIKNSLWYEDIAPAISGSVADISTTATLTTSLPTQVQSSTSPPINIPPGSVTEKKIKDYGVLKISNPSNPLLVVYGGINVDGRTSGQYMWDYVTVLLNQYNVFVATDHNINGIEAYKAIIAETNPPIKVLYLFSGGGSPGNSLLGSYGQEFSKVLLVDIWMGSSNYDSYITFSQNNKAKTSYFYTSFGAESDSRRDKVKGNVSYALANSGNNHMNTNKDAVSFLSGIPANSLTPGSSATTTSTQQVTTFSVNDAISSIQTLKDLKKDFFYGGDPSKELGVIGDIYVSLDFLYRQSLSPSLESGDNKEKNEIDLFKYIKSIASGIQVALGNINNFEVHVDPVDNIARIVDINYAVPTKPSDLFTLKIQNTNSIVRSYKIQSQIFPNQSALITMGSQPKGGVQGSQNNTLVDFNRGLVDRIIKDKEDPKRNSLLQNTVKEPNLAYNVANIVVLLGILGRQVPEGSTNNVNIGELVSKAKNSLRDIIVYFQSLPKIESPGRNRGVLPLKYSFTMDGIGGLVIGSLFKVESQFIPKGYKGEGNVGAELVQTISGISHEISDGDWKTTIEVLNALINRPAKGNFLDYKKNITEQIKEAVIVIVSAGAGIPPIPVISGFAGGPPPSPNNLTPADGNYKISPVYKNLVTSAKACVGLSTAVIDGTSNGRKGCAAAVSIIFLRATGFQLVPGRDVELGTGTLYSQFVNNPNLWEKLPIDSGQPGDIIITAASGKPGHVGVIIDTKNKDGSYDIISNSSGGFSYDKTVQITPGSIQNNYSVNKWSSITARNPNASFCFRYKGPFA